MKKNFVYKTYTSEAYVPRDCELFSTYSALNGSTFYAINYYYERQEKKENYVYNVWENKSCDNLKALLFRESTRTDRAYTLHSHMNIEHHRIRNSSMATTEKKKNQLKYYTSEKENEEKQEKTQESIE